MKTPCRLWEGCKTKNGYGRVRRNSRNTLAHVFAYEQINGPVPDGFELHHECENPACVNPEHVAPLTRKQHAQLSRNRLKTHCEHGHPFDAINTYFTPGRLAKMPSLQSRL